MSLPTKIGPYHVAETLGRGTFGLVLKGFHELTREPVAIKLVDKARGSQLVDREIQIMSLIHHPNIVHLIAVLEDANNRYLILEYVAGGELFDYLVANNRLSETKSRGFFRDIVSALEYCHGNLIVHRDLKPENLLLTPEHTVKINDFGLSTFISAERKLKTFCGSPLYAAPEILAKQAYSGPGVDLWSLGVVLYALVTGSLPWDVDNSEPLEVQIDAVLHSPIRLPDFLSASCQHLINRLLTRDHTLRITLPEIRLHPWVNEGYAHPPVCYLKQYPPVAFIDDEIMDQLFKLGFAEENAREMIHSSTHSQLVASYHLLLERKAQRRASRANSTDAGLPPILEEDEEGVLLSSTEEEEMRKPVELTTVRLKGGRVSPAPRHRPRSLSTALSSSAPARPQVRPPPPRSRSPVTDSAPSSPASAPAPAAFRPSSPRHEADRNSPPQPRQAGSPSPPQGRTRSNSHSSPSPPQSRPRSNSHLQAAAAQKAEAQPHPHSPPQSHLPPQPQAIQTFQKRTKRSTSETGYTGQGSAVVREERPVQLRVVKGIFNVATTTTHPASRVIQSVQAALLKLDITHNFDKPFLALCQYKDCAFEVEVCEIFKLSLRGVRLKRTGGDTWLFKEATSKIVAELKL